MNQTEFFCSRERRGRMENGKCKKKKKKKITFHRYKGILKFNFFPKQRFVRKLFVHFFIREKCNIYRVNIRCNNFSVNKLSIETREMQNAIWKLYSLNRREQLSKRWSPVPKNRTYTRLLYTHSVNQKRSNEPYGFGRAYHRVTILHEEDIFLALFNDTSGFEVDRRWRDPRIKHPPHQSNREL